MQQFASLAEQARDALSSNDHYTFASLMNQNFDLRRKLYGDEVIGEKNLEMIGIARRHGHAAKFCGSGGCIVGLWDGNFREGEMKKRTRQMRDEFQREGVFQLCLCFEACQLLTRIGEFRVCVSVCRS